MRILDLFSGIGGFSLAASWVWPDLEIVSFVEIDPFCQKVLKKNFPGVPIHDNIKTFPGRPVDLLTGGFPCQPFSVAGKRKGKEDDRDLWPEMFRVIQESKPTWVIGENVTGFVRMELDRTVSDLEAEGYEVQPLIIPACAVNAPHRRDRVWIIAHAGCKHGEPGREKLERSNKMGIVAYSKMCRYERRRSNEVGNGGEMANGTNGGDKPFTNTNNQRLQRHREHGERPGERPAGAPNWQRNWYEVATEFCRMDARVSRRVDRLKALGNAIVPQVAYEIMKKIKRIEDGISRN